MHFRLDFIMKANTMNSDQTVHRLYFLNSIVFLSLKIMFVLANSAEPD